MELYEVLERYPDLEQYVRSEFTQIYLEIFNGHSPLPEMEDYIIDIGVKNTQSRQTVFQNFQVLF